MNVQKDNNGQSPRRTTRRLLKKRDWREIRRWTEQQQCADWDTLNTLIDAWRAIEEPQPREN